VSVFIVHRDKVLLIYHKYYNEWLPIGGHIELDEDPEEALYRVKLHTREHREFRWLSKRELKDPALKLTRSIYFYCLEALKKAAEFHA